MKKITTTIVGGFVPRLVAPTQTPIQGSDLPAGAGYGWRLRFAGDVVSIEPDSAGQLTV